MRKFVLVILLAALGLAPTTSSAQGRDEEPLSQLLPELYRQQIQREFFAFIEVALDRGLIANVDLDQLEQNMQSRLDVINHLIGSTASA